MLKEGSDQPDKRGYIWYGLPLSHFFKRSHAYVRNLQFLYGEIYYFASGFIYYLRYIGIIAAEDLFSRNGLHENAMK